MVAGTRFERVSPGGYPGVGAAPTTPQQGADRPPLRVLFRFAAKAPGCCAARDFPRKTAETNE